MEMDHSSSNATFSDGNLSEFLDEMSPAGNGSSSGRKSLAYLSYLKYIVLVSFLTTFVFGIIGNTLTIFVILKNNKMKTVATCFILNLAIADDLFILSLPFFVYTTFSHDWVFGEAMCKILSALYSINMYCSIYTMVVMALDRYLAIVKSSTSLKYRTISNATILCLVIWGVSFLVMLPYWLFAKTKLIMDTPNGRSSCSLQWPDDSATYIILWTNVELVVGFLIPLIVIFVCYVLLLRNLRQSVGGDPGQEQTKKPIKKVTFIMMVVTIVFFVCWTPYHIIEYIRLDKKMEIMRMRTLQQKFSPSVDEVARFAIFNTVARVLVFLSSCSNPIIYAISSRNFSKCLLLSFC